MASIDSLRQLLVRATLWWQRFGWLVVSVVLCLAVSVAAATVVAWLLPDEGTPFAD
ncbi:hypothetical protein BH09PSE5_BH09PSE5_46250 [soil metagenome]